MVTRGVSTLEFVVLTMRNPALQRAERFASLLWHMTRCEYKLRDQGMALGFLWSLLNPTLLFLSLYFIFQANFRSTIPYFWEYLLIGVLQWNFFSAATNNALSVLTRKRQLVLSFPIACSSLVISAVVTVAISFFLELALMIACLAVAHPSALPGLPGFALATLGNFLLATGAAFLLAGLHVFFRDIEHFWSVVMRIGFVATPIFYPLTIVDPTWARLVRLNPLVPVLNASREALLGATAGAHSALGSVLGTALIAAVVGYVFFRQVEGRITEFV